MTARSANSEDGIALISVLWAVTAMSLIAAAIVLSGTTSLRVSHRIKDQTNEQALEDAAIVRAILGVTDPDPAKRYPLDGAPETFDFGGTRMTIAVTDELGKIDLNEADTTTLQRLLEAAGDPPDQAVTMASRIVEWRADRSDANDTGAVLNNSAPAVSGYQPRYGPFQSVDELKLVAGAGEGLFERLEPAITVYSHRPTIDRMAAPRLALAAQGFDSATIDALVAQRSEARISSTIPSAGRALSIDLQFIYSGRKIIREETVELSGDPARPFFTLSTRKN